MEALFIKLALATIPVVALIASITLLSAIARHHAHRHLAFQRTRRSVLRALAAGVMLR